MYHIIMNPTASSGKGAKVWKKVQKILQEENVAYEQYQTSSVMDTKNIVRRLTANADSEHPVHLIVLGGDGTLNTVLNGIEQFEYTTLSCIRTGSGNDFARNVGISKNVSRAMDGILHHPKDICLDYGIAAYKGDGIEGKRRFLISSGMGYDADICEEVSRSRLKRILNRIHLGKLVYVAIGIKQIFTRRSPKAVIVVDKETPINVKRLFFCVGMIHPMEGGGVPFCPGANPQDHMLDVCLVKAMPKIKLLLAVMLVYMKQHYLFSAITQHRCQEITITSEEPQWFHIDGETPGQIQYLHLQCEKGLHIRM
mgnify:FL=1